MSVGGGVEPVHQEAALVVHGKRRRPAHGVEPAGPEPLGRGGEEGVGHGLVVYALEEAEEAHPVAVGLVVQAVGDRGDAPDDLAAALRQEILASACSKKGFLLRRAGSPHPDATAGPRAGPARAADRAGR
jgi:hypothetical protein